MGPDLLVDAVPDRQLALEACGGGGDLLDLVKLLVIREEAALDPTVALGVVRAVGELGDAGRRGRLLEGAAELVAAVALHRPDRERQALLDQRQETRTGGTGQLARGRNDALPREEVDRGEGEDRVSARERSCWLSSCRKPGRSTTKSGGRRGRRAARARASAAFLTIGGS